MRSHPRFGADHNLYNAAGASAACVVDHWTNGYDSHPAYRCSDGSATYYWLTNTAISSARLYWDTRHNLPPGGFFDARGIKIPVAVSAFAEEIYQAPKSWAEKAYPKLIHYNSFDKGTHFAAWEQPKLFVDEMRAAFKSLR
jgi:pimeloyl-ACP methyl ester carboxylesterase